MGTGNERLRLFFFAGFVRIMATWFVENVLGDSVFATVLRSLKYCSIREYNDYVEQKNIYGELFYKEVRVNF